MINYLLNLIFQSEESLMVAETKHKLLVTSMSTLSDELSEMDQLLEYHFNTNQHLGHD